MRGGSSTSPPLSTRSGRLNPATSCSRRAGWRPKFAKKGIPFSWICPYAYCLKPTSAGRSPFCFRKTVQNLALRSSSYFSKDSNEASEGVFPFRRRVLRGSRLDFQSFRNLYRVRWFAVNPIGGHIGRCIPPWDGLCDDTGDIPVGIVAVTSTLDVLLELLGDPAHFEPETLSFVPESIGQT